MKQAVLNIMTSSGAFAPFRRANRHKALILMYHRFSRNADPYAISAQTFARHLEYLKAHYTLTTVSEIAKHIRQGSLPPSLAAITIDDGFRDAYEVAFPLLVRYDVPATVFVVTDFLDQKAWIWTDKARFLACRTSIVELETSVAARNLKFSLNGPASRFAAAARINEILKELDDNEKDQAIINIASALKVTIPEMPPTEYGALSWAQAREMDKASIEIASHTLTHPILTKISDERLRLELRSSRSRVEDMLGHESSTFCYPNGNYDARIVREVEQAGYTCAVSTEQGLNSRTSDLFSLQRFPALANFARFVKATSGFELAQTRMLSRHKLAGE